MAFKILFYIAIALAVFAALTLWKAARHEARAERSHPPEGRIITVNGHNLHTLVLGPDDGSVPGLVLIHGSSGNLRDFTLSLAARLARDYRVFLFDRPGLGYSDRINRTGAPLALQAAHLSAAARQLGARAPIVVGQSYGGAVALAWAVHQRENLSAVVSLAGVSHDWDTGLGRYYSIVSHPWIGPIAITLITAWVPDATVSNALREVFKPQPVPDGYDAHIGTGLTLTRYALRANALQRRNLLSEIKALQPHYASISVPVELVHGDADDTVPHWNHAERLVKDLPQANLRLLPGIGHMPHHVAEDEVIAAIGRAAKRAGLR